VCVCVYIYIYIYIYIYSIHMKDYQNLNCNCLSLEPLLSYDSCLTYLTFDVSLLKLYHQSNSYYINQISYKNSAEFFLFFDVTKLSTRLHSITILNLPLRSNHPGSYPISSYNISHSNISLCFLNLTSSTNKT